MTLRAATAADQEFLRGVFAASRETEVAALAADPGQLTTFIDMQFRIQQQSYQARFPAAENSIIVVDGQPIGRMLVDRSAEAIELIDIALMAAWRNRGIGTSLVRGLTVEAAGQSKPVLLEVLRTNPARRLYERLGFTGSSEDSMYIQMRWQPAAVAGVTEPQPAKGN